jgi:hypothetical protein
MKLEANDDVTHTHTHTHLSSLAQSSKSEGRICGNVGMQSNQSVFIMCNFYNMEIHVSREKSMVSCFPGNPHIFLLVLFSYKVENKVTVCDSSTQHIVAYSVEDK